MKELMIKTFVSHVVEKQMKVRYAKNVVVVCTKNKCANHVVEKQMKVSYVKNVEVQVKKTFKNWVVWMMDIQDLVIKNSLIK